MHATLGRISFNVGPLCTCLISSLLSLAGSRHNCTLSLVLGASEKLLHHSDVSCTPRGITTCCFCSLYNSSFKGFLSTYATLPGGTWSDQLPSLTCKLNMPSKHPVPENKSLNLLCI